MVERFNASSYLLDRHAEAGDGDRLALDGPLGAFTYAELTGLTAQVAAGLRSFGVRPEERVLLFMADSPHLVATLLGAMRMGAVPVPVSTMLFADGLAELLADSGARVLVVGAEFAGLAQDAVGLVGGPELVFVDGEAEGFRPFSDLLAAGDAAAGTAGDPLPTLADAHALWLYTSGTTGTAKGAMHRHEAIRVVCETYGRQVLGVRPEDRCYSGAKLFFAYGLGNSCLFPLSVGATAILEPQRSSPPVVAQRLLESRPTLFFGGPTAFAALLAADTPVEAFSSVRLVASAGEPLPAGIYRRFTERFGVDIIDGIGMTEVLHIFLSNRPGEVRPGTTGVPVPGYDLRIVDDQSAPVADDQPGHLLVRGDSIALGYWCRYDVTRAVFQGEWLRTGDTYQRSVDGYYTCLGRSNDMIKAGGIWVSPTEVETRLLEHPGVSQAVVVGVVDAEGLEKPVACIVRAPGSEVAAEELVGFCREGLPAFKRPREVLFFDTLPMTATGKLRRFVLREQAAALLAATPVG
ncbi:benzoate-CoA ligase family protein [soil metagenome]